MPFSCYLLLCLSYPIKLEAFEEMEMCMISLYTLCNAGHVAEPQERVAHSPVSGSLGVLSLACNRALPMGAQYIYILNGSAGQELWLPIWFCKKEVTSHCSH